MLNSGWTSLKTNVGRVSLGKKISNLVAPAPKVVEKKFLIQSTNLQDGWRVETPDLDEVLANDILVELRNTNPDRIFRIQEVK